MKPTEEVRRHTTLRGVTEIVNSEGKWFSAIKGDRLRITRNFGAKTVELDLELRGEKLHVDFPRYTFQSKTSHYVPTHHVEKRFILRKTVLFSVLRCLRRSGIWDLLDSESQTLIKVNKLCAKSDKDLLASQLRIK
mgnify:CR=1 FL=1